MTRRALGGILICLLLSVAGCDRGQPAATTAPAGDGQPTVGTPAAGATGAFVLPDVNTDKLAFAVQTKIGAARQVVRRDPNDLERLVELGALYVAHDFLEAGRACLQHAAELEPENFIRWYCVALTYDMAGNADQARAAYEQVLAVQEAYNRAHPDQTQPLYEPARLRLAMLLVEKDPARAATIFGEIAQAYPQTVAAHFGLAECARTQGRLDEAVQHYRAVLRLDRNCGPAHAALADLLAQRGQENEARAHREQTAVANPSLRIGDPIETELLRRGCHVGVWLKDATDLIRAQRVEEAENTVRAAIEYDASGVQARAVLARLRIEQGRLDDAARQFRAMLEVRPDYLPAKNDLAFTLMQLERFTEAEQLLREVLTTQPDNRNALERICLLMRHQKRPLDALPALQAALAARPDDAGLHFQVAGWQVGLGATAEALATLRRTAELQPDQAVVHHQIGLVLRGSGDKAGAAEAWRTALRLQPDYVEPRMALASLLLEEQKKAEAIALLREVVEKHPDSPVAHFHLGSVHYQAGDKDAARASWNETLRLAPDYVDARLALVGLLWEQKDLAGVEAELRRGLEHAAESPDLLNSLAWVLATNPDDARRNGAEAITHAEQACRATSFANAQFLDTLAAAYAEVGRYDDARQRIGEAIRLGEAAGLEAETLADFRTRQALYAQGQPYRETR